MDRYPYFKYTILLGATRAVAHIGIHFTHRVFGLSIYLLDRVRVSRQSFTTFIFLFLLLFFFLLFLFFSFLEDYIGLQIWVKQTYHGLPTCLRPTMQSEKRNRNSQPIGTIWCAVCELAKGGMFKVEHAGTSIDQKLNQLWNSSSIKVTCKVSIFRLKAIQLSN